MKALRFVLILFLISLVIADQPLGVGDNVSVTVIRANHFNLTHYLIGIGIVILIILIQHYKNKNKEVYYE